MVVFIEDVSFDLGRGWSAVIRPLTYRQREQAQQARTDKLLARVKGMDTGLLTRLTPGEDDDAPAAVAKETLCGDLDPGTVAAYGIVSITGPDGTVTEMSDEALDRLSTPVFEKLAREVHRLSTVGEDISPLSGG